ncbi:MAG TPA: DHH family phosphoesterase [Spirochaetota bacterium]|nr:DHH family phosphoesterase [Spirochaetota bacterium]
MKENWLLKPVDSEQIKYLAETSQLDHDLVAILMRRGYTDINSIIDLMYPSYAALHSPFLMLNMYQAVDLLRKSTVSGKKIGIFSDSDLDGLTSLYIVKNLLDKLGIETFCYYPNREHSEYGLTDEVAEIFIEQKVDLLITLDCGIRDIIPISILRKSNVSVLVCDHHEPDTVLPEAVIVNPKLHNCGYPFKELAGVGVAFKLCQAFLLSFLPVYGKRTALLFKKDDCYAMHFFMDGIALDDDKNEFFYFQEIHRYTGNEDIIFYYGIDEKEIVEIERYTNHSITNIVNQAFGANTFSALFKKLLLIYKNEKNQVEKALVHVYRESIFMIPAKIGDFIREVMPYIAIGTIADVVPVRDENRIFTAKGIDQFNDCDSSTLVQLKNFCKTRITSKVIGWQVAPLLNSPGRFGKTALTADFFLQPQNSVDILCTISELNDYRKKYVKDLVAGVISKNHEDFLDCSVIYTRFDKIEEGISGLIASRLVDEYDKPAVVVVQIDDHYCKGSGRSPVSGFYSLFEPHSSIFERFGGHDQALGFTICNENLVKLKTLIEGFNFGENFGKKEIIIDLEIDVSNIDYSFIKKISSLEPFGAENQPPVFLSRGVAFEELKIFGKKQEHAKLFTTNKLLEIIIWNGSQKAKELFEAGVADIVYSLELSNFMGSQIIRMNMIETKIN